MHVVVWKWCLFVLDLSVDSDVIDGVVNLVQSCFPCWYLTDVISASISTSRVMSRWWCHSIPRCMLVELLGILMDSLAVNVLATAAADWLWNIRQSLSMDTACFHVSSYRYVCISAIVYFLYSSTQIVLVIQCVTYTWIVWNCGSWLLRVSFIVIF